MPFNGSGTFTLTAAGFPVVPATTIQSAVFNNLLNDLANGLSLALTRDGQGGPSTNLPMGGFKHTAVAAATARNEYLRVAEDQDNKTHWFVAGGTANAITGALSPPLPAYVLGQTFDFIAAANNTGPVTLSLNGLSALAVTKNGTLPLVSGDLVLGRAYTVLYDGSGFQIVSGPGPTLGTAAAQNVGTGAGNVVQLDGSARLPAVDGSQLINLPQATNLRIEKRQAVQAGPMDGNGFPTYIPVSGSGLTLTTTGITSTSPLIVAAASGFNINGNVDRIGLASANLSFTLTNGSNNYLYVEIAANGTMTAGATTIAPVYLWAGTPSVTNGAHTFMIQEMKMYVGNGSVANAVYRVFIGEVFASGGNYSIGIGYAILARYSSGSYTQGTNTFGSKSHNIGLDAEHLQFELYSRGNGSGQAWKPALMRHWDGGGFQAGTAYYSSGNTRNTIALDYADNYTSVLDNGSSAATSDFLLNVQRRW